MKESINKRRIGRKRINSLPPPPKFPPEANNTGTKHRNRKRSFSKSSERRRCYSHSPLRSNRYSMLEETDWKMTHAILRPCCVLLQAFATCKAATATIFEILGRFEVDMIWDIFYFYFFLAIEILNFQGVRLIM